MIEYAYIDIVFLILLILLTVRGFLRGFVAEFFSLGAPVLGILAGFLFYKNGAQFLRNRYFPDWTVLADIAAFVAIFLIVFLICKIIQKIVSDVVNGMNLTTLNKVLGAVFGLAEGIVAVALVLFVIVIQPLFDPSAVLNGSIAAGIILPFISGASG
ncbi:MAG: CvpA family protein [Treponema sp.]|jgi:membrane protein required for colicin V production|nr:CvpA family protein [Treponema sp.]